MDTVKHGTCIDTITIYGSQTFRHLSLGSHPVVLLIPVQVGVTLGAACVHCGCEHIVCRSAVSWVWYDGGGGSGQVG